MQQSKWSLPTKNPYISTVLFFCPKGLTLKMAWLKRTADKACNQYSVGKNKITTLHHHHEYMIYFYYLCACVF